jgi:hypothetical protein
MSSHSPLDAPHRLLAGLELGLACEGEHPRSASPLSTTVPSPRTDATAVSHVSPPRGARLAGLVVVWASRSHERACGRVCPPLQEVVHRCAREAEVRGLLPPRVRVAGRRAREAGIWLVAWESEESGEASQGAAWCEGGIVRPAWVGGIVLARGGEQGGLSLSVHGVAQRDQLLEAPTIARGHRCHRARERRHRA